MKQLSSNRDRIIKLANMIYDMLAAQFNHYREAELEHASQRIDSIITSIPNADIGEYIGCHQQVHVTIIADLVIELKKRAGMSIHYDAHAGVLRCVYKPSISLTFNSLKELAQCPEDIMLSAINA